MPNKNVLEQKKQMVNELAEKLKNAPSAVIVDYTGITVEDDTAMRAELRKAGVEYTVFKNSITKRACEAAGFEALTTDLSGMTAIAVATEDAIAPAKILGKYAEKIETFDVKSGFIDGEILSRDGVIELSKIPSKEVLIGKVLGSLQSSLYGLAYVLQAYIDKNADSAEQTA